MDDVKRAARGVSLALLVIGCAGTSSPGASPTGASPSGPTAPSASAPAPSTPVATRSASPTSDDLPDPVDIEEAGAQPIDGTADTDWAVVVDGQAWIAGVGDGIGIFTEAGELIGSVAVEGWCASMDVGFGAIWSASCEPAGLIRIDPVTRTVERVEFDLPIVDSEASVGAGEGAVWLVAGGSSNILLGIDPVTLEIAHRSSIVRPGAGVRAGLGAVWITDPNGDVLRRVDPVSGEVTATIEVGPLPRFLAIGEGSVWVMNQGDGSVSRVDPATNTVTATIDVGARIHGGDITVGGGSVWVRGGPELLARIDPVTNEVVERYGPTAGSGSVAADDRAVWVTAHDIERIWRLPLP